MTKPPFRPTLTDLEARDVPAALLQFIQDSPYAAAAKLDVYVNNTLPAALTGFAFRSATPFLVQDTANPVFVSVRASGASVSTPPIFSQTFTLADNSKNILIALGDPNAGATAATKFQLLPVVNARTASATVGNAEFLLVNGSPDLSPLDVKLRGTGTLANDLAYGTVDGKYQSVAPANLTLDVTQADGVTRVSSFAADLTGVGNQAVTVLGSGFVSVPAGAAAANAFGLLAVNAAGTATLLARAAANPLLTDIAVGAAGNFPGTFNFAGTASKAPFAFAGNSRERVAFANVTNDLTPNLITGSGPGAANTLTVTYTAAGGGGATAIFSPFEASFTGGLFVTAGDLDGDGKAEVIVTPDQGGGPVVAIYSGAKLAAGLTGDAAQITRFFGIDDPAFRGGARAAVGDVSGDGRPDLVVAAGFGGGPRLALFDGKSVLTPPAAGKLPPKLAGDLFVFEQTLRNGVFVTVGDINADGFADVIVGGGPGGGPRVLAVSGLDLIAQTLVAQTPRTLANFFAGDVNNRDGVRVAAKDLDGDANADLVVGLGSPGSPQVRGFSGKDAVASYAANGKAPTPIAALDLNPFTNPGVVYVG